MIAKVSTPQGRVVLRLDGKLLASAYDPLSEARDWVERRRSFLDQVKALIVLGCGSGYHIAELARQTTARILVLDTNAELVKAVQEIHNFTAPKTRFEILGKPSDLRMNDSVRDVVRHSFVTLRHPPTFALNPEFFLECERQLIARDWGSLNWQWKLKGFGDLDSQPRIDGASEAPLSIYDLESTELGQNSEDRERMLIKALRELVK